MSHKKHTARLHKWVNGLLTTHNHHFDSFEEAKQFLSTVDADTVKIYDDQGQLVHQEEQPQHTYA